MQAKRVGVGICLWVSVQTGVSGRVRYHPLSLALSRARSHWNVYVCTTLETGRARDITFASGKEDDKGPTVAQPAL